MIVVAGRTLAGMAAAARLARLGHAVGLSGAEQGQELLNHFELPAAWRDLFKKSGQPLVGALNSRHLSLEPAPPTTYLLPDGLRLTLPDDRAGQFYAIRDALGGAPAEAWRDLLDDLDDVWSALRRFGLESPRRPATGAELRALWLDRTLPDVADRAGRLAPIILAEGPLAGTDSPTAPGLLAVRQVIVRTFGRHRLVHSGTTAEANSLVELLRNRLELRGVCSSDDPPTLDARPRLPRRLWRRPRAALVPEVTEGDPGPAAEIVDLTGPLPLRTIRGEHRTQVVDYSAARPDLSAGIAPDDVQRWLARQIPGACLASASCLAGGEPWAQLLSAALAVYELHEQLTGQDCRPTNRSFQLPRLARADQG